jgi:RHS repeat-associated protein
MTDRASSSTNIFWTSFNYPAEISTSDVTGSEEVLFSYGPDRQRVEQIYTVPGSTTEQTYYVGNGGMPAPAQLEVVFNGTTNYRHYIYAGSEPVALYTRTSTGGITMSYMLEDHQGGVSAITSNAGATDVDQSFSAFGQLRNSLTWSGAPTTTQLNSLLNITRQGYTFQTGLGQSMGLNHMNGRVQDAILGRFLSPDPHVPDRTNAQSYNRYTYANNNPVTLVDPSGFAAVCETWGFCSGDIGNLYSGLGGAESGSVAGLSGGDMSLTDSSNSSLALMVAFPSSWNWTGDEWAEANAVLNAALNPSTSNSGTTSSPNASVPDGTGLAGPPAQSQSSGGTVWGDGCGGTCDITAGVTVTTSGTGSVGSTPQNWVDPSLTQNFNQTPLGQFSLLNPRFYLEALVTKPLSWLTIRGLTRLGVPSTVVNTIFGVGGAAAIPLYEAGTAAGAEDLFFQQATQTLPQNLPGPYGSGVDMGGGVYWQEDFPQ